MRINGFRCDGCKKEHLLQPDRVLQYPDEGIATGWFVLWPGNRNSNTQPWTFCSKGCLHAWALDQIEETEMKKKQANQSDSKRRLILTLTTSMCIVHATDDDLATRSKAVETTLLHMFPGAAIIISEREHIRRYRERIFVLKDAQPEHAEWAKNAKACGLIDSYISDYDPEE